MVGGGISPDRMHGPVRAGLRGQPAETGDEVVLFGPGDSGEPTAQQWADALGRVSYEVVTNFAGGVPRTYRGVAYKDSESPGAGLSGTVTGPQA